MSLTPACEQRAWLGGELGAPVRDRRHSTNASLESTKSKCSGRRCTRSVGRSVAAFPPSAAAAGDAFTHATCAVVQTL